MERSSRIERMIVDIGTAICITLSLTLWISLASTQSTWLLPGAYFLEFICGAVVCFLVYRNCFEWASLASWIFCGMLLVFSVLAGFTVGIFYFPVFLIYLFLSIYFDIKHKKPLVFHLGIFVCTGLLQLGLMLLAIRFSF